MPAIDYDALAAQHGGTPAVDYDALAAQHGGTVSGAPASAPQSDTRNAVQRAFDASTAPSSPEERSGAPDWLNEVTDVPRGFINALGSTVVHPVQTADAVGRAFLHPMDTAAQAGKAFDQHPGYAIGQALGGTVAGAGTAGATAEGASLAGDRIAALQRYLRPPTSPAVVPAAETAARQLSAAVLPATKDATNFIQAAQQEVPNILDYAKRTGNPLNTQIEFSKAAQGYAQEVRGLYENDILGPVQNKIVKTTGTGFGQRTGEGPDTYATLGEIDKRVGAINSQLDAPTLNVDDARRALATKAGLQQEATGLRNILHDNLSITTGLSSDDIANLRQRVGRSYELANDTNAAVTQRTQAVGKSELGPVGLTQLPSRALEFARGGPIPIADRAFQRAISNWPGEAEPLPAIKTPEPSLPSSSARMDELLQAARQKQQAIVNRNAATPQPAPLPASRQLPARSGGPIELPYYPQMSGGERIAALMQMLRRTPQPALPAQAQPIQLPPGS